MKPLYYLTTIMFMGLCGCSGMQHYTEQPVNITGDSFCELVSEKLTWDVRDTKDTIQEIRTLDKKWESRCGRGKPVS